MGLILAMESATPVREAKDAVTAFVYTDAANYSDVYCWFAPESVELESKGADGYVLFSARYLFESCAAQELFNIRDH